MRIFTLLISLSLFYSCSSTGRYQYSKSHMLEPKHVTFYDAESQGIVNRQYYLNTERIYKKHIDSGQINNLERWSCFGNDRSTNYVNILKRYVPIFRTLAATERYKIKYRKVDALRNNMHSRIYTEAKTDEVSVESKSCWIKDDDGIEHFVVSEVYR